MKIYVLGAGSIGSLFGALLTRAGNDVTLIGREEQVRAILERGLRITGVEEFVVRPRATVHAPEEPPELLLLATKSYSTKAALECARKCIGPETWILSVQNGLGNEELAMRVTPNVMGGITTNGAMLMEWGVVKWTGKGITVIGKYPTGGDPFVGEVAGVLREAGLEVSTTENVLGWKWAKAIVNSVINGLGTVLEVKNGALKDDPYLEAVSVDVAREGCMVAQQLGVEFEMHPLELLWDTIERTRENYNSTLQDIRRGKRTEIDYINGKIVEYAGSVGLEAPRNELIWALVKAKENLNKPGG
ncbi:2-dehydropantoate 2-reductase [Thermococcus cleftensis]|uniref:2-dehydropantoate 2-reductase n=1 Tax=Thermococcus cleftensis (strain DSM 27260 / KACC 17922 / CL1) TaxID=163003 RepID=I3ZUS4_THECF|nr:MULTISPECIES: 2-dehydropantoate 2-reductase [Thermococcus]AFL95458.1 2-dehydropantoate 2-reductase [Thermococcus cleftensis]NJE04023.1 2-dehydropantoate 2-reductase [Thermococcus sp. MV11]